MKQLKRKNGKLSVKLLALLFTISALQVSAKTPYEFSVYAGGGYACFLYRPLSGATPSFDGNYIPPSVGLYEVNGNSSSGAAGELGVGFTGFITPYVGLDVGLGLSLHNVEARASSLKIFTTDPKFVTNDYEYDLFSRLSGYKETHRTFSLSIPFMFQFQTVGSHSGWNRRSEYTHGFYAKAGFKINILLSNTYELKADTLSYSGYFPELDNWAATQEFAGLGTFKFKGEPAKGKFGFVQAMLALEAGGKWRVADNMFIYTGVYFDYGLNDPSKNDRTPTEVFVKDNYTSLDTSPHPQNVQLSLLEFSNKMHVMTVGVKLRLAFIK